MTEYDSLTVEELKSILVERELKTNGKKSELITRLVEDDNDSGESDRTVVDAREYKSLIDKMEAMNQEIQTLRSKEKKRSISDDNVNNSDHFSTEQMKAIMGMMNQFHAPAQSGDFIKCKQRFSGNGDEDVEAFIDAVLVYKDCARVSDGNALRSFPTLLLGTALTWWSGVKNNMTDWNQVLNSFKSAFCNIKPAHQIFSEIFSKRQNTTTNTELFICESRSLLAKLPYNLEEIVLLDIIYSQLKFEIRKLLPRNKFKNFDELIHEVKSVEEIIREEIHLSESQCLKSPITKRSNSPSKSTICSYCEKVGHTITVCRKFEKFKSNESNQNTVKKEPGSKVPDFRISCYGCQTPGVLRRDCPKCSLKGIKKEFSLISLESTNSARPTFEIEIFGHKSKGVIDTGAKNSIASEEIYQLLKSKGSLIEEIVLPVRLADGISNNRRMLTTKVDITVNERTVNVEMFIFPDGDNNTTLLGMDVLNKLNVSLALSSKYWYFDDEPQYKFKLNYMRVISKKRSASVQ